MSGAIRRFSAQREYDLARWAFDSAHEQFLMAQKARKADAERRCKVSAAKYMESGFRHFALANQLLQEGDQLMSDNSRINKQSSALADEAAARAKARKHQSLIAFAGAETRPAVLDSSGNVINEAGDPANVSPRDAEKRAKAKKALHG